MSVGCCCLFTSSCVVHFLPEVNVDLWSLTRFLTVTSQVFPLWVHCCVDFPCCSLPVQLYLVSNLLPTLLNFCFFFFYYWWTLLLVYFCNFFFVLFTENRNFEGDHLCKSDINTFSLLSLSCQFLVTEFPLCLLSFRAW